MKKRWGVWTLLALALCVAHASSVVAAGPDLDPVGPSDPAEIEAFVDDFWAGQMRPLGIPGAVFVLVRGDQILLAKGYGLADVEQGVPVDPGETLFAIGSVSKAVTASAVMQLVERGQLDLDAPVDEVLTSMQVGDRCAEPVTTAHLLTHSAGLDERVIGAFVTSPDDLLPLAEYVARDLPPCIRPPGQEMSYSNHAYALAGLVVQDVSRLPFEQYVEENIFRPLEMRHSTFRQPLPAELEAQRCTGYIFAPEMQPAPHTYGNFGPSGSMWATGQDMGRYLIAQLRGGLTGGETVFEPESLNRMHQRQFSQDPRLEGWTYGFFEHMENGERLIGKDGDSPGFSSALYLMPERDLGFFFSYNATVPTGQLVDDPRLAFPGHFVEHYFPGDGTLRPARPSGAAERLSGPYRWSRYGHTSIDKILSPMSILQWRVRAHPDGSLTLTYPSLLGELSSHWVEVEPGLFQNQASGQYLAYRENGRGRVTHIYTKITEEGVLERVSWYETLVFQAALLGFVVLTFGSALIVCGVDTVKRIRSARRDRRADRSPAPWLSGLLAGLGLLFLIGLAFSVVQSMAVRAPEVPPYMLGLLILPLTAIVLTLALLVYALLAWVHRRGSLLERIYSSVVVLAGAAFVWFAWYWNLLGFKL